jgi:hypothetical protein
VVRWLAEARNDELRDVCPKEMSLLGLSIAADEGRLALGIRGLFHPARTFASAVHSGGSPEPL